jgi:hypothetical protein
MYTLLNPCDQVEFPNTAFELPGAKRHERNEEQNRERARHGQEERRVTTAPGAAAALTAAGASTIARVSTITSVSAIADVSAIASVTIATGVTPSHRVGVRRRHGMLGMFCIDSGIIL